MFPALIPGYWLIFSALLYVSGLALVGLISFETYADLPALEKGPWKAVLHVLRPLVWPVIIFAVIGWAVFLGVVRRLELRTSMALEDLKERK